MLLDMKGSKILVGEERHNKQYPIKQCLEQGCRIALGSDWPVSSVNPLDGIQVCFKRNTNI